MEDMRTYHIAQYEPELAESQDIDQISIYHYRTWTNPKSPNLRSTQEEPVASGTYNHKDKENLTKRINRNKNHIN